MLDDLKDLKGNTMKASMLESKSDREVWIHDLSDTSLPKLARRKVPSRVEQALLPRRDKQRWLQQAG